VGAVGRGLDVAFRLEGDPRALDGVAEAAGNLAAAKVAADRKEPLDWRIFRIDQLDGGLHYRLAVRHPARLLDLGLEKQLRQELARRCTEPPERLLEEYRAARARGLPGVALRAVPETVDYWADPLWVRIGTLPPANPPP
jgi:hypothetical protein